MKPPTFLVGAPRSGTSLLYRALALHPEVAYISNWVQRFPVLPQLSALNRLASRMPVRRSAAWFPEGNAYVYGRHRERFDRVFPAPAEGEPVFSRAGVTTDYVDSLPEIGEEILSLRRAFASIVRWSGAEVLVVKRIANNRRIPLLRAAFPDARFLEISRDGRAVAQSISKVNWWPDMRVWWLGQTPGEWAAAGRHPMELCAMHWRREIEEIDRQLTGLPSSMHLPIRYEDIIADPLPSLERIAEFIGVAPQNASWQHSLGQIEFPDQNRRWVRELSSEEIEIIERVQRDQLRALGYTLSTTDGNEA